ncbi:MAG: SHOCT domain-containing protein [Anaerolineaceae bacterium]|nr:SHOCT domain-containing protein [Anaerolineaceae bacterium]
MNKKDINKLAKKYNVSPEAVTALSAALLRGNLTMAQFSHPDLGGSGQWMQGGMTMIGDMFNDGLKATVNGLCAELAAMLAAQPAPVETVAPSGQSQQQSTGKTASSGTKQKKAKPPAAIGSTPTFQAMSSAAWWPAELGSPNSSGAQNNMRYAYFASARRLVVDIDGQMTVYDSGDHHISGVSQQQSGTRSVTFTSQHGLVKASDLKVVSSKK